MSKYSELNTIKKPEETSNSKYSTLNTSNQGASKYSLLNSKEYETSSNNEFVESALQRLQAYNNAVTSSPQVHTSEYADKDSYVNRSDYADLSKYVSTYNPTYKNVNGGFTDLTYDAINRNKAAQVELANQQLGNVEGTFNTQRYNNLTDDEIGKYNYIYATQGSDKALEYANSLDLDKRQYEATETALRDATSENDLSRVAMSALSVPLNIASGFSAINQYIDSLDGEMNPYASYNLYSAVPNTIRDQVSKDIVEVANKNGKSGQFASMLYQSAMSTLDSMLRNALMGGISGKEIQSAFNVASEGRKAMKRAEAISLLAMSSGAFAQTVQENLQKGYSQEEAMARGTFSGAVEFLSEMLPFDYFLADNAKTIIGGLLGQTVSEGLEEVASDLANWIYDWYASDAYGHENEIQQRANEIKLEAVKAGSEISEQDALKEARKEQWMNVLMSFLGGAISGGVMGGVSATANTINDISTGKSIKESSDYKANPTQYTQDLIDYGKESNSNAQFQNTAQRAETQLNKKGEVSNRVLGNLESNALAKFETNQSGGYSVDYALREMINDGEISNQTLNYIAGDSTALDVLGVEESDFTAVNKSRAEAALKALASQLQSEYQADNNISQASNNVAEIDDSEAYEKLKPNLNFALASNPVTDNDIITKANNQFENNKMSKAERAFNNISSNKNTEWDSEYSGYVTEVKDTVKQILSEKGMAVMDKYAADHQSRPVEYMEDIMTYYRAGRRGVGMMDADYQLHGEINAQEATDAWRAGFEEYAANKEVTNTEFETTKKSADRVQVYSSESKDESRRSGANVSSEVKNYDSEKLKDLDNVAKALGVKVTITKDTVSYNAKITGAEISIGENVSDPAGWVFNHEITHRMQDLAPEAYKLYRDYVEEYINKYGFQGIYDNTKDAIKAYQKKHGNISKSQALDEIAADFAGHMVEDPNSFTNLADESPKAAKGLLGSFKQLLDKLKGNTKTTYLEQLYQDRQKVYDAWQKAYDAAVKASKSTSSNTVNEMRFALKDDGTQISIDDIFNQQPKSKADEFIKVIDEVIADAKGKPWNGNKIREFYKNNPEVDFVVRIQSKDPTAKADLVAFLKTINDKSSLEKIAWYGTQIYNHQSYWSGTYPYRSAIKYVRDAISSRLVELGVGTNLNIKNGAATVNQVEFLFNKLNSNDELGQFAKKVFDTARMLNVDIRFSNSVMGSKPKTGVTAGISSGKYVDYKTSYFNDPSYTDQKKASTIIHELIHACTSYAIESVHKKNSTALKLTDGMVKAVLTLDEVYTQIKNDSDFKGEYGISNEYEMIAELANVGFRDKLQKKGLLQKVFDAIKSFFGIKQTDTVYDVLSSTLDYMLDNVQYNMEAYEEYSNKALNWLTDRGYRLVVDNSSESRYSVKDSNGNNLSKKQLVYFANSKIRDANGNLLVMYHGTSRADRVGFVFRPDRATSGPMAFFTSDRTIAENYAKDKRDTSIAYDDMYSDYYTQFRVERNGENMSIVELWNTLSASEKNRIKEAAKHVTFDDSASEIVYDKNAKYGVGAFDDYTLNMNKGNALQALVQTWLEDGNLFGEEERFIDVLKLVGIEDATYMNPNASVEGVYEVYLNVTNPFNATTMVDKAFVDAFEDWASKQDFNKYNKESKASDNWDKYSMSVDHFVERLRDDVADGTTHAWTSIPDIMTDYLKELGYDGIVDQGGKQGGETHTVVIPFSSNQIKNISNANPTTSDDIRYSISDNNGILNAENNFKYVKELIDNGNSLESKRWYYGSISDQDIRRFYTANKITDESDRKAYGRLINGLKLYNLATINNAYDNNNAIEVKAKVVNENAWTNEMIQIDKLNKANGLNTIFFVEDVLVGSDKYLGYEINGSILIKVDEGTSSANIKDGNSVIAKLTKGDATTTARHERLHSLYSYNALSQSANKLGNRLINYITSFNKYVNITDAVKPYYDYVYNELHGDNLNEDGLFQEIAADIYAGSLKFAEPKLQKILDGYVRDIDKALGQDTSRGSVRYSIKDSEGNNLNKNQQNYFKYSKARDENGNLLVMYHGTRSNSPFSIFNTSIEDNLSNIGSHFGSIVAAESFLDEYSGYDEDGEPIEFYDYPLYKVYLNITNPYYTYDWFGQDDAYPVLVARDLAEEINTKEANDLLKQIENLDPFYTDLLYNDEEPTSDFYLRDKEKSLTLYKDLRQLIELAGYDGLAYENDLEDEGRTDYVALYPEQIKLVDNQNPTTNEDVRYSVKDIKGDSFNIVGNVATYTDQRIDAIIKDSDYGRGRTDSYIAYINPLDFIRLTTTRFSDWNNASEGDMLAGAAYNALDKEKLASNTQTPFLYIEMSRGGAKVTSHEGRHRMLAMAKYGIDRVPVRLIDRENRYKEDKTVIDQITLRGQDFNGQYGKGRVTLSSVIPVTPNNRQLLIDTFGGESDVRFSVADQRYAPVFYSKMNRVIDDIKQPKIGADSVISYLKGKGVKDDEIKWSGVEEFLQGKKSVTKQELQEFARANELQIEEQTLSGNNKPSSDAVDSFMSKVNTYLSNMFFDDFCDIQDDFSINIYSDVVYEAERYGKITEDELDELLRIGKEFNDSIGSYDNPTQWSEYKLSGGENYRELLFKLPGSTYMNTSMNRHWGAAGVLAHARVQDFDTADGKMLFIDEIQSDWHNAGQKQGYIDKASLKKYEELKAEYESMKAPVTSSDVEDAKMKLNLFIGPDSEYSKFVDSLNNEYLAKIKADPNYKLPQDILDQSKSYSDEQNRLEEDYKNKKRLREEYVSKRQELIRQLNSISQSDKAPDAPFSTTYIDYALKRLIRMAAEEGYDSIGWTTGKIQEDRWSDEFAEGYRIEYDQDIPKFLNKYGRKWGGSVSKVTINESDSDNITYINNNGAVFNTIRDWYDDAMDSYVDNADVWDAYIAGKTKIVQDGNAMRIMRKDTGELLPEYLNIVNNGDEVWQFVIPDSMKESVLYEGQPRFALKGQSDIWAIAQENEVLKAKLKDFNKAKKDLKKAQSDAEYWKSQTETTKTYTPNAIDIKALTKDVLNQYGSKLKSAELNKSLTDLGTYIMNGDEGNVIWEDVKAWADKIASDVIDNALVLANDDNEVARSVLNYLKKTAIRVSAQTQSNIADYKNWKKEYRGKLKISDEGAAIDSTYRELQDLYGIGMFPEEIINEADQLIHMASLTDELEDHYVPMFTGQEAKNVKEFLAQDIIDRLVSDEIRQTNPTYADKMEKEVAKAKIKGAERYQQLKDRMNKKIESIKQSNQLYKDKTRERLTKKDYLVKIEKHTKDLQTKLLRASDNKHIPQELQDTVIALLQSINTESTFDFNADGTHAAKGEGTATQRTRAFQDLQYELSKLSSNEDLIVDPDLELIINEIIGYKDTPIKSMSIDQLENIWNAIKAVEATISTSNQLFKMKKYAKLSEYVDKLYADNKGSSFRDFNTKGIGGALGNLRQLATLDMYTPQAFMHQMGMYGDELFKMLRKAQDAQTMYIKEASDATAEALKGVDQTKLEKEIHTFNLSNGQVKMSTAQIMDLYLLMNRDQAREHILVGGILPSTINDGGLYAIDRASKINVSDSDLAKILGTLTQEQREIANKLQKTLQILNEYGNAASMEVYGYEKFTDPNYWAIKVDKHEVQTNISKETGIGSIAGKGMAKSVKPHANNAVLVGSIFDVYATSVNDMVTYAALLAPMYDLMRIYNYNNKDTGVNTKAMVKGVFGRQGEPYFTKLIADLNRAAGLDDPAISFGKFTSNMKAAAVAGNIRVIIQQPTAILRAMSEIDSKYLMKGIADKGDWNKVLEYSPIAVWKDWGNFDINTGRQMKDVIMGTDSKLDKAKQWLMEGAGKADSFAWSRLWNAVEYETQDLRKDLQVGSEEYYQYVADRFADIIDKTQVVDGILQRSQIMRSTDQLKKMSSAFMSEPTKVYNMVLNTYYDVTHASDKKAASEKMGKTITALLASFFVNAIAQSVIDALRDDDKDQDYFEKLIEAFIGITDETTLKDVATSNFVSNFMPLSYVPYLKDLYSMLQGYSIERSDLSSLQDTINAATSAWNAIVNGSGSKTKANAIANLIAQASKLFGLPVATVKRDLESFVQTIAHSSGSYTTEYYLNKALYSTTSTSNRKMFYDILYNAYVNDKAAYKIIYRDMLKSGFKAETIQQQLQKRVKENR